MKPILKIILYLILLLVIIYCCCAYFKYNINVYEANTLLAETKKNEEVKRQLLQVVSEIITKDTFKNQFITGRTPTLGISAYYEIIICHPLFIECFIDTSFNEFLLILKEKGEVAAKEYLNESLVNYIKDNTRVINDILNKCLPSDFKLENKQDLFLLLKEFAKLLTNSKPILEHVTSSSFFENFFASLNIEPSMMTPKYLADNIELIKCTYANLMAKSMDHSLIYKIFSVIGNVLMLSACIKLVLTLKAVIFLISNLSGFTMYYHQYIRDILILAGVPEHLITHQLIDKLILLFIKTEGLSSCVIQYLKHKQFDEWISDIDL